MARVPTADGRFEAIYDARECRLLARLPDLRHALRCEEVCRRRSSRSAERRALRPCPWEVGRGLGIVTTSG